MAENMPDFICPKCKQPVCDGWIPCIGTCYYDEIEIDLQVDFIAEDFDIENCEENSL